MTSKTEHDHQNQTHAHGHVHDHAHDHAAVAPDSAHKVKDPVCGMEVDPQQARADGLTFDVAGVTHFFCSEACKQQFQQEPSGATGAPAGTHAHDLPPDHGKGAHD